MEAGGLTGAVFNGAKERALDGFIAGELGFLDMASVVEDTLGKMAADGLIHATMTLDSVAQTDHLARIRTGEAIAQRS